MSLHHLFPQVLTGKLKPVVSQSDSPFIWNLSRLIAVTTLCRSAQEAVRPITIITLQFPLLNAGAWLQASSENRGWMCPGRDEKGARLNRRAHTLIHCTQGLTHIITQGNKSCLPLWLRVWLWLSHPCRLCSDVRDSRSREVPPTWVTPACPGRSLSKAPLKHSSR